MLTDVSPNKTSIDPALYEYLVAHSTPVDEVATDLIERTQALGDVAVMQVSPEQGTFLTMLTRLIGARRAVEVGTFTGYSALCIARGLPGDGRLLCCDISEEWTAIGREAWATAGVADRIELRIAPALDTLRSLPPDPVVDLAFLDADKESYWSYYQELLPRLRPGGLLLVDNAFFHGRVLDRETTDPRARAIQEFNDRLVADDRVEVVMLAIADGLTFVRKRDQGSL